MTEPTRDSPFAGDSGRVVRTLRDGYWECTEVVQMADRSQRVRKRSKGDAPPGPWGVGALRREIEYLATLTPVARSAFPPLLARWDESHTEPPRVGYEVPFYPSHLDAGELARRGALAQAEVDSFQDTLAAVLLQRVHETLRPPLQSLSAHVVSVVQHALDALQADPVLARLIGADSIRLNGEPMSGPRAAFARARAGGSILSTLDAEPQVRLHGDLFLENILWRPASASSRGSGKKEGESNEAISIAPRLLLIDPVSVAGVVTGTPLFDLVKYESYTTGELLALRSEWVDVGGFDGSDGYLHRIRWQDAGLEPLRAFDWHTRFRRAFEHKYGVPDGRAYRLISGYFGVVMAVNTGGVQRRARLLQATLDFNEAAATDRAPLPAGPSSSD